MSRFGRIAVVLFVAGFGFCDGAGVFAAERAFWVWNRSEPLTAAEAATLHAGGVKRLYWQVGELEMRETGKLSFHRTAPQALASLDPSPGNDLEILPVVRIATAIRSPENFSGEALGQALLPIVQASPGRTVQIDFDCPDRLLGVYADRLRTARKVADIRRLYLTALDGWADAPRAGNCGKRRTKSFPCCTTWRKTRRRVPAPAASLPGSRRPCSTLCGCGRGWQAGTGVPCPGTPGCRRLRA